MSCIFDSGKWCFMGFTFIDFLGLILLDLYGVNVRPVAPFGSASSKTVVDPALIHRVLPDELIFEVLITGLLSSKLSHFLVTIFTLGLFTSSYVFFYTPFLVA